MSTKTITNTTADLRDQFAMAALTGLLSYADEGCSTPEPRSAANIAYAYADAMLEARMVRAEVKIVEEDPRDPYTED